MADATSKNYTSAEIAHFQLKSLTAFPTKFVSSSSRPFNTFLKDSILQKKLPCKHAIQI